MKNKIIPLLLLSFIGWKIHAQEMVNDFNPIEKTGSEPHHLANFNGSLIFTVNFKSIDKDNRPIKNNQSYQLEASGSTFIEILPKYFRNYPEDFIVIGNSLFFMGNPDGSALGYWKLESKTGNSTSEPLKEKKGKKFTDKLLQSISVNDQPVKNNENKKIEGLTLLKQDYGFGRTRFLALNNIVYFIGKNDKNQAELWKSDGTPKGTMGTGVYIDNKKALEPSITIHQDKIFYCSKDNIHGLELWVTDGTPANTKMVKDINKVFTSTGDTQDSNPTGFIAMGDILFFLADDGINGKQLWRTNGTEEGTYMVRNIPVTPDYASRIGKSPGISNLTVVGNWLYFSTFSDKNKFLWKTDGTEKNTIQIIKAEYIRNTISANNKLFFVMPSSGGDELWSSDGTTNGTFMVKDINPGSNNGIPSSIYFSIVNHKDILYFVADDGIHGLELWRSDGTESGTVLVKDIKPFGKFGSEPKELTLVNDVLYFSADDGPHGRELWKYILPDILPGTNKTSSDVNAQKNNSIISNSTLCFYGKTKGYECDTEIQLELSFSGSRITGSHNERCGGGTYAKSRVEGYQKSDSLFLSIKTKYGKTETTMPTIWLLKSDKLSQFDTETKNGKAKLTPGAKNLFTNITNKVTCK